MVRPRCSHLGMYGRKIRILCAMTSMPSNSCSMTELEPRYLRAEPELCMRERAWSMTPLGRSPLGVTRRPMPPSLRCKAASCLGLPRVHASRDSLCGGCDPVCMSSWPPLFRCVHPDLATLTRLTQSDIRHSLCVSPLIRVIALLPPHPQAAVHPIQSRPAQLAIYDLGNLPTLPQPTQTTPL